MHNKQLAKDAKIGVRTREVPGGAKPGKDFTPIDYAIDFSSGKEWADVDIEVIDDEQWEPDKEFKVELYDCAT